MRVVLLVLAGSAGCSFGVAASTLGDAPIIDAATGDGSPDAAELDAPAGRVTANLVALYTFEEGAGLEVIDRSGFGTPLNLVAPDAARITWGPGTLTVTMATLIASPVAATKVLDACRDADALTLEAWITPAVIGGTFPRVVTLASTNSDLALTLMAIDTHFEFRMRGPMTDGNGLPSLNTPAGTISIAPIHVVLVSESTGMRRIYIDGTEVATDARGGDLVSWGTTAHRLGIANEIDGGRPWLGTYDLVAIYAAALAPDEVMTNFAAGPQ